MKQTAQRQRSTSEPLIAGGQHSNGKLSKPPRIEALHERPRNRLQKRSLASTLSLTPYPAHLGFSVSPITDLYLLEYEPYPYNTLPSTFLGVYSTVHSVTAGAFAHGAYTFSREGLLDGTEYLSPTGRIKIQSRVLEQQGTAATVAVRSQSLDHSRVDISPRNATREKIERLDIPHPAARSTVSLQSAVKVKERVFLAVRQGPTAAHCMGVYATRELAWGACLKNKAACALEGTLSEESRDVGDDGMPRAVARLHGCGQHLWAVVMKEVDEVGKYRAVDWVNDNDKADP
jgi:hypothetical protein